MRLQLALVLVCIISCFSLSYQLSKESRITIGQVNVPFQFKPVSRAISFENLTLHISLRRRNADEMEKLFWEVSNPKSSLYAQYLTVNELGERFGASMESIHTVSNWLKENRVYGYELALTKDIIRMEASVYTLEKLFQTSIFTYVHVITGEEVTSASGAITVPHFISEHIQHVSGLDLFSIIENKQRGLSTTSTFSKRRVEGTESNLPISFLEILPLSATQPATLPSENLKLVVVQIICNNGPGSVFPSCASIQSAVIQYAVNGQSNPPSQVSIPIGSFSIFNTSGEIIYLRTEEVVAFNNYLPYNMSTFLIYNNGSVSNVVYAPVLYYTSRYTTPDSIASYYGTKSYRGTNTRNSQAFAGLIGQYFSENDLYQFFDYFGLERRNVSKIVGYNNQSNPGMEASLDVQYIMGVGLDVSTQFWSMNMNASNPFMDYIYKISSTSDSQIPYVHSFSYVLHEIVNINQQHANTLNQEFMKAGLRGLTFLFATGDGGVGTRNILNPAYPFCEKFTPTFPASSPYVTAVGATQWSTRYTPMCEQSNNCQDVKEIACMSDRAGGITTGGGFSTYFPMPDYQKNVVRSYLNSPTSKLPPSTTFNSTGRAYPDISVVGSNFIIFYNGKYVVVSGTSASTPTFAAMVSLLNNARLNAGKKPLGFINPWLYQLYEKDPGYFNDIVVGNNKCSAQYQSLLLNYYCCANGFHAAPGYDAVTGLGSPQFEKLYSNALTDPVNQKPHSSKSYIIWIVLPLTLIVVVLALVVTIATIHSVRRRKYNPTLHVPLNDVNVN